MELALGFLLGLIVGAVAVYVALRRREAAAERAQAELSNAFKALAGDALKSNNQAFLDLAAENLGRLQDGARADLTQRQQAIDAVLTPLKEALGKVEGRIGELEQARVGAYTALREQVGQLLEAQGALRGETATLAKALRAPSVRGRWGELQLRRVVELAGLVDRVDFSEQPYVAGGDGAIRPDMTVRLPGGGIVVVDAKAPLTAYLAAHEATDEATRKVQYAEHARAVREHARALGRKGYWTQFTQAPEFVVLFLPGEAMFGAALDAAPDLIEEAWSHKVVLATPTNLIALLRTVALGWRQETLAESARAISGAGQELYKRLSDFGGSMATMGKELGQALNAYNRAVASLESRVMPSARRLKELGAAPDSVTIELPQPIIDAPRSLTAREFLVDPPRGQQPLPLTGRREPRASTGG
jgi:DNA recombination protein RmuC